MKREAIEKIKSALTPDVTFDSIYDADDGIIATVRHEYRFGFPMGKLINIKANKDGEILETLGLF